MAGRIDTRKDGVIGWIIFDHQERRNAISLDMWRQIPRAVQEMEQDDAIRVIVVRGAGDQAFIAGADISEFEKSRSGENIADYDQDSAKAFSALALAKKPVIAMIHGFCIGGGVAIALTADMRYAADDALLGVPAARLGLGYHMAGIETCTQLVGPSNTKELFFTAKRFPAREALRMGLLNGVYGKDELEAKVRETAEVIGANAPLTIQAAKLSVQEVLRPEAQRDYGAVERAIQACFKSDDYKEGVSAFLEKRRAQFKGR